MPGRRIAQVGNRSVEGVRTHGNSHLPWNRHHSCRNPVGRMDRCRGKRQRRLPREVPHAQQQPPRQFRFQSPRLPDGPRLPDDGVHQERTRLRSRQLGPRGARQQPATCALLVEAAGGRHVQRRQGIQMGRGRRHDRRARQRHHRRDRGGGGRGVGRGDRGNPRGDRLVATLGPGGTLGVVGGVVVFAVATVAGAGVGTALILGVVAGVAIGAVTNALIKFRPLNVAEIAFARQVFGNSLPYQDVIITNLAGLGDRAFSAPGVDGKTYLNLGHAYDNPLGTGGSAYPKPGHLLIHELTHAWQIAHAGFLPGLMCSGMVNQANFILGDNVYEYGAPGPGWSKFNAEQQGAIVDQWFGGTGRSSRYKEMDQENPYYRYVWNDVTSHLLPDEARANLRATASSALNVVSRDSLRLELFWARNSGAIRSQWWAGAPGQSWGDHGPSDVVAAGATIPGASVTTVARTPDNLDVYWVTPDGAVAANWWFAAPGASWADHGWFTITPPSAVASAGGITATARTPNNLDVFWVAPDGSVGTQWWPAAAGHSWADHSPFAIAPPGSASP